MNPIVPCPETAQVTLALPLGVVPGAHGGSSSRPGTTATARMPVTSGSNAPTTKSLAGSVTSHSNQPVSRSLGRDLKKQSRRRKTIYYNFSSTPAGRAAMNHDFVQWLQSEGWFKHYNQLKTEGFCTQSYIDSIVRHWDGGAVNLALRTERFPPWTYRERMEITLEIQGLLAHLSSSNTFPEKGMYETLPRRQNVNAADEPVLRPKKRVKIMSAVDSTSNTHHDSGPVGVKAPIAPATEPSVEAAPKLHASGPASASGASSVKYPTLSTYHAGLSVTHAVAQTFLSSNIQPHQQILPKITPTTLNPLATHCFYFNFPGKGRHKLNNEVFYSWLEFQGWVQKYGEERGFKRLLAGPIIRSWPGGFFDVENQSKLTLPLILASPPLFKLVSEKIVLALAFLVRKHATQCNVRRVTDGPSEWNTTEKERQDVGVLVGREDELAQNKTLLPSVSESDSLVEFGPEPRSAKTTIKGSHRSSPRPLVGQQTFTPTLSLTCPVPEINGQGSERTSSGPTLQHCAQQGNATQVSHTVEVTPLTQQKGGGTETDIQSTININGFMALDEQPAPGTTSFLYTPHLPPRVLGERLVHVSDDALFQLEEEKESSSNIAPLVDQQANSRQLSIDALDKVEVESQLGASTLEPETDEHRQVCNDVQTQAEVQHKLSVLAFEPDKDDYRKVSDDDLDLMESENESTLSTGPRKKEQTNCFPATATVDVMDHTANKQTPVIGGPVDNRTSGRNAVVAATDLLDTDVIGSGSATPQEADEHPSVSIIAPQAHEEPFDKQVNVNNLGQTENEEEGSATALEPESDGQLGCQKVSVDDLDQTVTESKHACDLAHELTRGSMTSHRLCYNFPSGGNRKLASLSNASFYKWLISEGWLDRRRSTMGDGNATAKLLQTIVSAWEGKFYDAQGQHEVAHPLDPSSSVYTKVARTVNAALSNMIHRGVRSLEPPGRGKGSGARRDQSLSSPKQSHASKTTRSSHVSAIKTSRQSPSLTTSRQSTGQKKSSTPTRSIVKDRLLYNFPRRWGKPEGLSNASFHAWLTSEGWLDKYCAMVASPLNVKGSGTRKLFDSIVAAWKGSIYDATTCVETIPPLDLSPEIHAKVLHTVKGALGTLKHKVVHGNMPAPAVKGSSPSSPSYLAQQRPSGTSAASVVDGSQSVERVEPRVRFGPAHQCELPPCRKRVSQGCWSSSVGSDCIWNPKQAEVAESRGQAIESFLREQTSSHKRIHKLEALHKARYNVAAARKLLSTLDADDEIKFPAVRDDEDEELYQAVLKAKRLRTS